MYSHKGLSEEVIKHDRIQLQDWLCEAHKEKSDAFRQLINHKPDCNGQGR